MPNWKRVIVSGSSAHLNHVTASGHISGSSTSTGSFGRVNASRVYNVNRIEDDGGELTIRSDDLKTVGDGITIQNSDGSDMIAIALDGSVAEISSPIVFNNPLSFASNLGAKISGSSISTGSFGHLVIAKDAHIGEDVLADGDVVAYNSSDIRLKDNVEVIKGSLDKIEGIRGVEFDWNEKSPGWAKERGHDVGVIAQEVQKVVPEIVVERKNGYLGVDYKRIVPLLIESVKELRQEVNDLKKKVS